MSAGNSASIAKNATPAAMIEIWSSLMSCFTRSRTSFQPRAGIWVGASASRPLSASPCVSGTLPCPCFGSRTDNPHLRFVSHNSCRCERWGR